jgi:hypothetical protein
MYIMQVVVVVVAKAQLPQTAQASVEVVAQIAAAEANLVLLLVVQV